MSLDATDIMQYPWWQEVISQIGDTPVRIVAMTRVGKTGKQLARQVTSHTRTRRCHRGLFVHSVITLVEHGRLALSGHGGSGPGEWWEYTRPDAGLCSDYQI